MENIKKQFSDLRKSTPKHIQWLLLAAAFVVVLILLTLLFTQKEKEEIKNSEELKITLNISPDSINWADTKIGEKEEQTIKVSSSAPAKILDIHWQKNINGLSNVPQETCTRKGQVDLNNSCTIIVDYQPTEEIKTETVELYIDWRGINEPDAIKTTSKVIFVVGAEIKLEPEKLNASLPDTQIKETVTQTVTEEIIKEEPVLEKETAPIKQEIKEELETIAPAKVFIEEKTEPKSQNIIEEEKTPAESCSDFAFPGYNLSGVQSGWIKPEAGAYYFHPFSDKNCDTPTGVYNPNTGIITDIKDRATKIGTDAEHIGYSIITNGTIPQLSNPTTKKVINKARQLTTEEISSLPIPSPSTSIISHIVKQEQNNDVIVGTSSKIATYSSDPFDRTFVLRQYKPIPATIVSEVRADPSVYCTSMNQNGVCTSQSLPVRATVDRNVYSDNGRTVVIPAGTLLLGYLNGELPGPYKSIGRMNINWYQFILPNGVEFNFQGTNTPFSGDSQGRVGVPGHGSTDYVEQFVMPMLTAIVPAAVNMIAPISDTFINQIDLDNNTVVQSGTVRSSELAKNEIITAWNQVAQKLLVDMMENTVPPFSIAAGTRITVFSPTDLVITCGKDNSKKCSVKNMQEATGLQDPRNQRNDNWANNVFVDYTDGSWVGQVRSFNMAQWCELDEDSGAYKAKTDSQTLSEINAAGYSFSTVEFYCRSASYQAINNAKQDALYQSQKTNFQNTYGTDSTFYNYNNQQNLTGLTGIQGGQSYNEDILGLTYNEDGTIQNPFQSSESGTSTQETVVNVITCDENGTLPDEYGCCPGEIYTDMGEQGFNCCPETGGDCFPPILY